MRNMGLNILIAASEAAPLAKEGGLGDVAGSLPQALKRLGCNVSVILPAYRRVMDKIDTKRIVAEKIPISLGNSTINASIEEARLAPGIPLYLVRRDELFDRKGLYGNSQGEYFDNPERYIFFSKTIFSFYSGMDNRQDIILCNDWQTGLVMPLLAESGFNAAGRVFAIHNIGYLGLISSNKGSILGLPDKYYGMDGLEFYGKLSLLKAGITYSHAVTTVSPSYANEIMKPEFGAGLDGLMRSISHRLYGILNGVDYKIWNPGKDMHLAATYSRSDLSGKAACKKDLLEIMGLPVNSFHKPLIGMITRLVDQKGCDLVIQAAKRIFSMDLCLILLGTGEKKYHNSFKRIQSLYPDHFALKLDFDEDLSHKIVAGSDMFLIPSLYEPCGLTQLFSMKYGTVPIVRAVGGLEDTIIDPEHGPKPGTGFKFTEFSASDMVKSIRRAVILYQEPKRWRSMMRNCMLQDFSWDRSAKEYMDLFANILEKHA